MVEWFGHITVSYDVSALFTSIPVDEAIRIIRVRLEKDIPLSERCDLSTDQIITLLELSLNITYFVCHGVFYCQIRGAPMGSPISLGVANLAIEDFEEKALDSALTNPHVWYRYVDDTFMILHEYAIQEFTEHINSQSEHIKLTIEAEQDGQLLFLDTLVILNDEGTLKTKIYRKPTHIDQYLNWNSNHHLEHKRSVVRTLLRRAETVVSELEDVREEVNHIKKVMTMNGYKKWSF